MHIIGDGTENKLQFVEFWGKSPYFEPGTITRKTLTSLFGELTKKGKMQAYIPNAGSWSENVGGLLFTFDGEGSDARVTRFVAGYFFYSKDGQKFKNKYIISKEDRRVTLSGKNVNMRTRPTVDSPVVKLLKGNEKLYVYGESVEEVSVKIKREISAQHDGKTYRIPEGANLITGGPIGYRVNEKGSLEPYEIGVYVTRVSDNKNFGIMIPISALDTWKNKMWVKVKLESGETGWVISDYIEQYPDGETDSAFWDFMVSDS